MVLIILWWVQQCHIYVLTLIMLRLLDSTYVIRLSTTSAQAYTLQWKWNGKRIIHNCWKSSMEGKCMACLPTFAECLDTKSEIACIFSSNRSVNVICYVMSVQPHTYPLPAVLADSWGTKWKIGLEIMVRGGPFRKEDVNTWWKKMKYNYYFHFLISHLMKGKTWPPLSLFISFTSSCRTVSEVALQKSCHVEQSEVWIWEWKWK